jgi:hypothetical protein
MQIFRFVPIENHFQVLLIQVARTFRNLNDTKQKQTMESKSIDNNQNIHKLWNDKCLQEMFHECENVDDQVKPR